MLGHADRRTTSTCLHMDVDTLARRALDPEAVAQVVGLGEVAAACVAGRRAVGHEMGEAEGAMGRIAAPRPDMGRGADELSRELVEARAARRPGETETTRFHRMGCVRGLGGHVARMGLGAYVLPGRQGHADRESYGPYIFTDAGPGALFAAADKLAGEDPACRRAQMSLVPGLPCSSGLRSGGACGLRREDVGLDAGVLSVRHAKDDRDRTVPTRPALTGRMRSLSQAAQSGHPRYPSHGLLWSLPEGRAPGTRSARGFFRDALWGAGISHGGRGKGPRVHDLRLAFACHRLRGWVDAGDDVSAPVPYLATYMGHADTRRAEYYLRLTAEQFPGMVARAGRECGWAVPSWAPATSRSASAHVSDSISPDGATPARTPSHRTATCSSCP